MKVRKAARKLAVSLIGFPLFVIGLILIPLPVPTPGVGVVFVAALILSIEFPWAKRWVTWAKRKLREIYKKAKERADKIESWGEKTKKE